jgi:hypothetical protein
VRIDNDDLENRIKYHRPNADAIDLIADMRRLALAWSKAVVLMVPEGREQSLALTKIEEALFWSNAGIARDPDNWDETQPEK